MLGKEDYRPHWIPKRIIVKGKEIEGEKPCMVTGDKSNLT
jgi:hypothetical protein